MKKAALLVFASGAFCAALPLWAQDQPAGPPAVLRLFREDVKEGKGMAHEKSEAAFMQALAKANYPTNVLGLEAISGPSEALFLEGHESFESIEKSQAALEKPEFAVLNAADGELLTGSRAMIAVYRPDISYSADKANLPKARFFSVETIRVREGQEQAFVQLAKMVIAAAEKSGDTAPAATYQVVSGAPNGTYVLLEPTESLKSMDEAHQRQPAFVRAMGEEGMKEYQKALSETIANSETLLFGINPKMSYPPKAWITADPDFWAPKPVKTTQKPPAKAGAKTTASK